MIRSFSPEDLAEMVGFAIREISKDQDQARLNLNRAFLLPPEIRWMIEPTHRWVIEDGHAKKSVLGRALAYLGGEEDLAAEVIVKIVSIYRERDGYRPEWRD